MPNPISPLIPQLEHPAHVNLDELLDSLRSAANAFDELSHRTAISEYELQKELKAIVDLIGPTPLCAEGALAFTMQGEQLVIARRAARKSYNDLFRISPVRK